MMFQPRSNAIRIIQMVARNLLCLIFTNNIMEPTRRVSGKRDEVTSMVVLVVVMVVEKEGDDDIWEVEEVREGGRKKAVQVWL